MTILPPPEPCQVPEPLPIPRDFYRLQTSRVAGLEYHHISEVADRLQLGSPLTLLAEPANPHDRYAVRIQLKDTLIGYLPRASNHIVSRLLRQSCPLTAQVAYLSKSQPDLPTILPVIDDISIHVLLPKRLTPTPKKKSA